MIEAKLVTHFYNYPLFSGQNNFCDETKIPGLVVTSRKGTSRKVQRREGSKRIPQRDGEEGG